jgi:hypothetical protein
MEQIKLDVGLEGNELTIRHGDAQKLPELQSFSYLGNIDSVSEYLSKIDCEVKSTIIIADYENGSITLFINNDLSVKSTVKGQLVESDLLEVFCVNKPGKLFTQQEIIKLFRMNRLSFLGGNNNEILNQIQNFVYSQKKDGIRKDDQRGNIDFQLQANLESNITEPFFNLSLPIYCGQEKQNINVELVPQIVNNEALFYLESVDLKEKKELLKKDLIQNELNKINEKYVKIEIG